MSDDEALTRRLETVEAALAHQERTIADLDRVVLDQWRRIEELSRQLSRLTDQMREAEGRLDAVAPPEPPPPHY
ncbi:SlyX family protein [Pinisolibacter sp.]|uniref:SlyX family protein n=1 Tax=Pinisolibacter sp. TaxID=2172024 RepID=UPI002FDD8243